MKRNRLNKESIRQTIDILKNNGVVIFPTDTVYGIGTKFDNTEGIKRIYEFKKRDIKKPIIALISNIKYLSKLVDIKNKELESISEIIKEYWPGELTIVFNGNDIVKEKSISNDNTVGVRIPKNKILLDIIEACGGIILTTSANISGELSPAEIEDISTELLEKVDYILDDGKIANGTPSTVIKYVNNNIDILREGNIKQEQILNLFRRAEDR